MSTWRCEYCETINEIHVQEMEQICPVCGRPAPVAEAVQPKREADRPHIPAPMREEQKDRDTADRQGRMRRRTLIVIFLLLIAAVTAAILAVGYDRGRGGPEEQTSSVPLITATKTAESTEVLVTEQSPTEVNHPTAIPEIGVDETGTTDFSYEVGSTITMGRYNGKPIEWQVLEVNDNEAVMISVKGLDAVYFNSVRGRGNDWSTSFVRGWLNTEFYEAAFGEKEKAQLTTGETGEKVCLLSIDEVKQYFDSADARICYLTETAKKNGSWTNDVGACRWWLRSPGNLSERAVFVREDGTIDSYGAYVNYTYGTVRPVIVLQLSVVAEAPATKLNSSGGNHPMALPKADANETGTTAFPCEVGSTITMGRYNGEPIEWRVIGLNGDESTLISVKGLAAFPFNKYTERKNKWASSDIRIWLNGTFYEEAFSNEERSMIVPGETGDRVWLLSAYEAGKAFPSSASRAAAATEKAMEEGVRTNDSGACRWWLRTPASATDSCRAAYVLYSGEINYTGLVDDRSIAVRPVIVVKQSDRIEVSGYMHMPLEELVEVIPGGETIRRMGHGNSTYEYDRETEELRFQLDEEAGDIVWDISLWEYDVKVPGSYQLFGLYTGMECSVEEAERMLIELGFTDISSTSAMLEDVEGRRETDGATLWCSIEEDRIKQIIFSD